MPDPFDFDSAWARLKQPFDFDAAWKKYQQPTSRAYERGPIVPDAMPATPQGPAVRPPDHSLATQPFPRLRGPGPRIKPHEMGPIQPDVMPAGGITERRAPSIGPGPVAGTQQDTQRKLSLLGLQQEQAIQQEYAKMPAAVRLPGRLARGAVSSVPFVGEAAISGVTALRSKIGEALGQDDANRFTNEALLDIVDSAPGASIDEIVEGIGFLGGVGVQIAGTNRAVAGLAKWAPVGSKTRTLLQSFDWRQPASKGVRTLQGALEGIPYDVARGLEDPEHFTENVGLGVVTGAGFGRFLGGRLKGPDDIARPAPGAPGIGGRTPGIESELGRPTPDLDGIVAEASRKTGVDLAQPVGGSTGAYGHAERLLGATRRDAQGLQIDPIAGKPGTMADLGFKTRLDEQIEQRAQMGTVFGDLRDDLRTRLADVDDKIAALKADAPTEAYETLLKEKDAVLREIGESRRGLEVESGTTSVTMEDIAGKDLDEIRALRDQLRSEEKNIDKAVLGDRAEAYDRAQRIVNSAYADPNSAKYKEAGALIDEVESGLSQSQKNRLFGIGETGLNAEDLHELVTKVGPYDTAALRERSDEELLGSFSRILGGEQSTGDLMPQFVLPKIFTELSGRGVPDRRMMDALMAQLEQKGFSSEQAGEFAAARIKKWQEARDPRLGGAQAEVLTSLGSGAVGATIGAALAGEDQSRLAQAIDYGLLATGIAAGGIKGAKKLAGLGREKRLEKARMEATLSSLDPEVEARWQAAKGIQSPGLLETAKEAARGMRRMSRRTFEHIDPDESPQMAVNQDVLRLYRSSTDAAQARAFNDIVDITEGLGTRDADVFSRNIQLPDLIRTAEDEISAGKDLPFGYRSTTDMGADLARYQDEAARTPSVQAALKRREEIVGDLTRELVDNDLLAPEVLNDPRYFHRQVMKYVNANDFNPAVGSGSQDLRLKRKGFQKSRKGSEEDFNTKYHEAEFEWMSHAYAALARKRTLADLKQVNDIAPDLRAEAKLAGIEDYKELIPEDHIVWSPKAGQHFYEGVSVNERALDDFMRGTGDLTPEDLSSALMVGRKPEWVIPTNLARTMDEFNVHKDRNQASQFGRAAIASWKQWVLMNPLRVLKYNVNNMSGDLDIAMAYNPKIVTKYGKSAAEDLYKFTYGKASPELKEEMQDLLERGVIGSGMTIHEIPEISKAGVFKKMMEGDQNWLQQGIGKYWDSVRGATTFRENLLRVAAYRNMLDEVGTGKQIYGASHKSEIDAMKALGRTDEEVAAKLSRELIGDYGNLSVAGQYMRETVAPFWSWVEINAPRYYRLFKNAPQEEGTMGRLVQAGAKRATVNAATLTPKAMALYGLVQMWNHEFFPEEAESLSRQTRQLHLVMGHRADGSVRSLRFEGALADALEWGNLQDLPQDVQDITEGRSSFWDKAAEVPKGVAERLVNSYEPYTKTGVELLVGRSFFPQVFEEGASLKPAARPIRNRWEHAARMWSLDGLVRRVAGVPAQKKFSETLASPTGIVDSLLLYRMDPDVSAYWEARGNVIDWQRQQGMERNQYTPTEKANALYYYKTAVRLEDEEAAVRWLNKYMELGGTRAGMAQSAAGAHPLGSLSKADKSTYLATLNERQRAILKQAEKWHQTHYGGLAGRTRSRSRTRKR